MYNLSLPWQLTKYQEQPQLLDGTLEAIVQPLAQLLRQVAVSSTAQDTALVQGVCRMLHVLITVRGYKTVVRFFPHEAADLERVLQVSLNWDSGQRVSQNLPLLSSSRRFHATAW